MAPFADGVTLTTDPAWPWSLPVLGPQALFLAGVVLVVLTVWTYRGVRQVNRKRLVTLIAIRLAALLLAGLAVLRPSLAVREDLRVPSTLLIAADASRSMTIQDQHDNQARWDYLRRLLKDCEPELRALRDEHNVTVIAYRFAEDVKELDLNAPADGRRTDFGEMLHAVYERHGGERALRGLLVLSDGADNGARYPALPLAAKLRSLGCPVQTFGFGKTTTSSQQKDIALTAIHADPSPVPIKGKLQVKGTVDAPGFERAKTRLHLFLADKEVAAQDVELTQAAGNALTIACDAPAEPGEIKVTLRIDPLPGEVTETNNEVSTYLTVTKEGISVLYVEGKYRAWEPKFIRYALTQRPEIRLFEAVRLSDTPPPAGEADLFGLEKQHYDVIILGDVSARRLSAGNPGLLAALNRQVFEKGVGFLMLGGYETFGNGDWEGTDVARMLPVQLDVAGQVDGPVQMVPTADGLRHYVLRLADREADNKELWAKLPKLDGITKLGRPKPGAVVLAESDRGESILVGQLAYGSGRTLAFAGDTTWRWRRDLEGVSAHTRFWQQVVLWLAKREDTGGNIVLLPDTRRLPAGGKLGFGVKLRGKGGVTIPPENARFEVTVTGPGQADTRVPTARERGEERGVFWKTDVPGEYTLTARGSGTDVDGKTLDNLPPASIRFVVYQDEAEMVRQAADHDFLRKLADSGGGKLRTPAELKNYLHDLAALSSSQGKSKQKLWPDWRRNPSAPSAGAQADALVASGMLACFVLFVALLCLEWFLRRLWGLV